MQDATILRTALLRWYDAHARTLPWRSEPSPYRVLLSELMLQQTRVDTALPYFERFVARWPTLADMARATEQDVVEAWAGLGYYRRARFLHRAVVAAEAIGGLPDSVEALRALPGIGPYTAGAIASIAFGVPTPLVDGNVERVLSRVDDRDADPRSKDGRAALWARAEALVDPDRPGDLNQALMELGALICTPRAPRCDACPWAAHCRGKHRAEALPNKAPRKKPTPIHEVAAIARQGDRWLFGRRPEGVLLGGLWEPPRLAPGDGEGIVRAAERAIREGASLTARGVGHLGRVVHVFSHRKLTLDLVAVDCEGMPVPGTYDEVAWAAPSDVALSRLGQKAVEAAVAGQTTLPLVAEPPPEG